MGGSFSPSYITNTTFQSIYCMNGLTEGGVLNVFTNSYNNIFIEKCIFSSCNARRGGALCYQNFSFINISLCRFENNTASNGGYDIYIYICLSHFTITDTCTTTISGTVICGSEDKEIVTCIEDEIVSFSVTFIFVYCCTYLYDIFFFLLFYLFIIIYLLFILFLILVYLFIYLLI
jgi:hypothetical protein